MWDCCKSIRSILDIPVKLWISCIRQNAPDSSCLMRGCLPMLVDESKLKIWISFKFLLYGNIEIRRCSHSHITFFRWFCSFCNVFPLFRLKKLEEKRHKAERQRQREEKRKKRQLMKLKEKETQEMNMKIAVEEKKLLIAQRKLESIRLLDELFERVKVCWLTFTLMCYWKCVAYDGEKRIVYRVLVG